MSRLLQVALCALPFVGSVVSAEDVLHSRRLSKRFIDDEGHYNISFYHINDVHAHLDQFSSSGTDCTNPTRGCYGGYARVKHVVDQTRPDHPDSLFLNAGDEFQGTLFYSYYGGEKIAETLNQLGFDGMTLGNHEFDGGDDKLGAFLENLTFPIISANIKSSHPALNKTIKPFHIYEQYDLAVIGVTTETTPGISRPSNLTTFSDSVKAVQDTIDHIRATTDIKRIAALTHIGYEEDKRLAEQTSGLHLIMGGHSHTLVGDMPGAEGPYPTIATNRDGEEVFVVTAYRWGEYLGYIDVTYDSEGKILAYHGAPIHLDNKTEQDPGLQAQVDAWRAPFAEFAGEVVGFTNVELDQTACRSSECLLGDLMADAMVAYRKAVTPNIDFALINGGGVRATIPAGNITRGGVLTSFPFGNTIVDMTITASDLWLVLEGLVSGVNQFNQKAVTSFPQVSKDINIVYDPNGPVGSRLRKVTINGEPLTKGDTSGKVYTLVTLDFLAGGGDNFFVASSGFATLDAQDVVLLEYLRNNNPIDIKLDGRIRTGSCAAKRRTKRAAAL
ncbi:hypothetical protein PpBr36_02128 [Pyricularia pennisetigena]|uniref:hypothetical protein n=1 Tax=Pyricularia pennisetigena TaxID=1578925 RepID=UPI00114E5757|nr:hypothetical protein PpBr36_02128 [Pyricularia pennisetigena]TLS28388.1 hypothetical protein PpBr36_02128 [Pyricularia pennisetigena]